jgi:D-alanyl-D-alanine endopeptidase (penicillin-binding protein 7)
MNGLRAIASQMLAWAVLGGVLILAIPAAEAAAPASAKRKAAAVSKAAPSAKAGARPSVRSAQARSLKRKAVTVKFVPRPSFGELSGLHGTVDPLALRSSVAFVVDQDTQEVLFEKNAQAVLPIASITKLMTSLVVVEADEPLDELITVTQDDVDTEKGSRSRLVLGTQLTRGELLHLALMSSENRAAHALGRQHPGGLKTFVSAMNAKAMLLGMKDTRFVEPTGLSSRNQSTARDLAALAAAASEHPLIRELSTSPEHSVAVGPRTLHFRNTNRLVLNPESVSYTHLRAHETM